MLHLVFHTLCVLVIVPLHPNREMAGNILALSLSFKSSSPLGSASTLQKGPWATQLTAQPSEIQLWLPIDMLVFPPFSIQSDESFLKILS